MPPVEEICIRHQLLVGLPSKGTVRATFSLASNRARERGAGNTDSWRVDVPSSPTTRTFTNRNAYLFIIGTLHISAGMTVWHSNELVGGVQTLPLDFHQDVSGSGGREIWHSIKEIIPNWSAHTYSSVHLWVPRGDSKQFPNFTGQKTQAPFQSLALVC